MWYSRKNLVDEFNNNPETFLMHLGYMVEFHRPVIIKRHHKGYGGLYWQYDLKPSMVGAPKANPLKARRWDDYIDIPLPDNGDEVLVEPTRDWKSILGGLMKAVNTGSMVDDAERIAVEILSTEHGGALSEFASFRIQIDAYLYMAAIRPSDESAEGV